MPDLKCDWRHEGVYPLNSKVRKRVLSKTTSYCDCCRLDSESEAFQFAGAEKKKDDIVSGISFAVRILCKQPLSTSSV